MAGGYCRRVKEKELTQRVFQLEQSLQTAILGCFLNPCETITRYNNYLRRLYTIDVPRGV